MPWRTVVILLVIAVVFAVFYRDQINRWIREALSDKKTEEKKKYEPQIEEKENHT